MTSSGSLSPNIFAHEGIILNYLDDYKVELGETQVRAGDQTRDAQEVRHSTLERAVSAMASAELQKSGEEKAEIIAHEAVTETTGYCSLNAIASLATRFCLKQVPVVSLAQWLSIVQCRRDHFSANPLAEQSDRQLSNYPSNLLASDAVPSQAWKGRAQ